MAPLNGQQFAKFVQQVHNTGGATMDVNSGKLIQPGQHGYMVGGETDQHGERIPTTYVPEHEFSAEHVSSAVDSLHQATGGKTSRVNLGAWVDNGTVELDASRRVKRPAEAIRKGRARGEKAVWDNKRMKEIDTGGRK